MRFSEVDLLGLLVSPTVPLLAMALVLLWILRAVANRAGIMGRTWHPPLASLSALVIILSVVTLVAARLR